MDTAQISGRATRIRLGDFRSPQMRAFHLSWFAFFLAFSGWFGVAPLMAVVREDLELTRQQIGNTVIASVAITILARLLIGWLTDRVGPRRAYTALLAVGALPVMGIGLAQSYETFLLFRLGIGVIGAAFVITQYHTSVMFAPNVVGTANATSAGWGNLGGGVTQVAMPLIFAALLMFGVNEALGWRLAMIVPGVAMLLTAVAYYRFTQDAPEGDFSELRRRGRLGASRSNGAFLEAARDRRVWALFAIYGACFGVELTLNNIAALYFHDRFGLGLGLAGLVAGLFGMMNIFARTLGGVVSDLAGGRFGLRGRVWLLAAVLVGEGLALMLFSQMSVLAFAIPTMILFSLFVQMSEGATYAVVPFVNPRALGAISGIVGAGGNVGAVLAGFLFRLETLQTADGLLILGMVVVVIAPLTLAVRFAPAVERSAARAYRGRIAGPAADPALEHARE